ncbi:MAG TPA: hypothetical protein VMH01_00245 [Puia sp.]|nr:hypothetical protein [Puia sp.]
MRILLPIFIVFVLFAKTAEAQTNNSPYSIIGIGDIEDSYFNRTSGMANTGIGYRNSHSLINNNPASFSALDNQFFTGEIGVRGKLITYYGSPIDPTNNVSSDITFRRFVLGIKAAKHWGTSIGLVPFSSENYEFTAPQLILGTNGETTNSYAEGFGGINRVYWANSYEFFNHLSIGVDASYLFGSINSKTILQNPGLPSTYVSTNRNSAYTGLYFNYGLQYFGKINKKWNFSVGGTFSNKTTLNSDNSIIILNIDSIQINQTPTNQSTFMLPVSYGVGFALTKNKKYTFLADYKYQDWSALHYSGFNYSLQSSERISVGFEISKIKNVYNASFESSFFQAGLYYNNSYLNVRGQSIRDFGGTIGMGINSRRTPFAYNFSLQYGVKGTEINSLIQERYFALTFVFSYREVWYTKGRKYE